MANGCADETELFQKPMLSKGLQLAGEWLIWPFEKVV